MYGSNQNSSFNQKERETINTLDNFHAEITKKSPYVAPLNIINKILEKTNNDPELTAKFCQLILESDIPAEQEEEKIEDLWNDIQREKTDNDSLTDIRKKPESLPNVGTILVNPYNNRKYKIKKIFTKPI